MENKFINKFEAHSFSIRSLIVWRDTLWSSSGDNTIKQWNSNGKCIKTLKGQSSELVLFLFVWKDMLHGASTDDTIHVWNFEGECLRILKGHTDWVKSLTSWRDFLISGSYDKTVVVWNDNGECITLWDTGSQVLDVTSWKGQLC